MKLQKIIIFGLLGLIILVIYDFDVYAQSESKFQIPDVTYGDTFQATGNVNSSIDEVFVRIKNSCDEWIETYRISTNGGAFEKTEVVTGSDWKYAGTYQGFLFVNQKTVANQNFIVTNPYGVSPDDCPETITQIRSAPAKSSDDEFLTELEIIFLWDF